MTASNFDPSLALVLKSEGGYSNNSNDPGGPTNMGITLGTLSAWRGHPVSAQDVKNLTRDEAAAIYRVNYWNAVHGDGLSSGLDYAVFDYAVNSGPNRAARSLQQCLGVPVDGAIGPVTLAAANKADANELITALCTARLSFLKSLSTWSVFGTGWNNRVNDVAREAHRMTLGTSFPPPPPVPTPKPKPAPTGLWARFWAWLFG